LIDNIFFLSLELDIRAGIGYAEQRIALLLEFGADPHAVALLNLTL
jgi:hypothetical protein